MRHLPVVLSLLIVPTMAFAQGKLTPRPLDPVAVETFTHALDGSAEVRRLVERLESSNVIVHIVTSPRMPSGIFGTTQFATSRGGYRYLRITLGADLGLRLRSAILGHELKHACEVADSTADDARSIRELFESEGHRAGPYFDTMAAIRTGRRVFSDLGVGRTLQAEPVTKFDH